MIHRSLPSPFWFSLAICGTSACAGTDAALVDEEHETGTPTDEAAPETHVGAERPSPPSDLPEELQQALAREAEAPGFVPADYPDAPYGFVQGSTVPNFDFIGWAAPTNVGYDIALLESIDLARFYDPDGEKGIELLIVSAVAVWCGVCQVEYQDLRDSGLPEELRARGVEMLGVLFEDGDALPARYEDLVLWSRVFEVNFPMVLDPGFKMGSFFDRSATPMNMVIDARSMQILVSLTGYNPEIYDYVDRELVERGR
jgi:hypothetical protein